jgi:nucleoside-diphosphate-sugar epimerase
MSEILAASGMEPAFGEIPSRRDQVIHMPADISRLTHVLDAARISIEERLECTVAWYRKRLA